MSEPVLPFSVAALYQFTRFDDCAAIREPLARLCGAEGVRGTLLLAPEGINGTIAGSDAAIAVVLAHIRGLPGCAGLDVKHSRAATMPFHRMKVRIKREIVTMGQPDVDPLDTGHYVEPQDWNALIDDPVSGYFELAIRGGHIQHERLGAIELEGIQGEPTKRAFSVSAAAFQPSAAGSVSAKKCVPDTSMSVDTTICMPAHTASTTAPASTARVPARRALGPRRDRRGRL